MRDLLHPHRDPSEVLSAFVAPAQERGGDRPRVRINMVASVDGATAVDGESRGLSGDADRAVFHRLRAEADVVMAGAATVRAARYGPAKADDAVRAARAARGQTPVPAVVVLTRGGDLPWEAPLFTAADPATVVAHPEDVTLPPAAADASAVRFVGVGRGSVDVAALLAVLGAEGVAQVLCEGGPGLIAQVAAAGCLDEAFVTVSPRLVSGDASRMMRGPELHPSLRLRLAGLVEDDGFLFARYHVEAP